MLFCHPSNAKNQSQEKCCLLRKKSAFLLCLWYENAFIFFFVVEVFFCVAWFRNRRVTVICIQCTSSVFVVCLDKMTALPNKKHRLIDNATCCCATPTLTLIQCSVSNLIYKIRLEKFVIVFAVAYPVTDCLSNECRTRLCGIEENGKQQRCSVFDAVEM